MRRIVLIAPKFFDYWKKIKIELEQREFKVYYINQSLTTESIVKRYIDRYGNDYIRNKQNFEYYLKKIVDIPNDVEYVLVIKGDSLDKNILGEIKNKFSGAKFIMYQWDSCSNSPNALEIAKYFDKIFTFDREDANKYFWEYRPLFFDSSDCKKTNKIYDILYICTLKYKRGEIYKEAKKISENEGLSFFYYLYIDFKTYIKRIVLNRDRICMSIPFKNIKFKPLSIEDTAKLYDKSKIVIDYTTPSQTGLSMRTIECLGHECKIITNNKNIKFEKFYSEENVFIYDDNVKILPEFIEKPYKKNNDEVMYYYSIKGWIDTILGED